MGEFKTSDDSSLAISLHSSFRGDFRWISNIVWSPNGRLLASNIGEGDIQIWDVETQKAHKKFRGHPIEDTLLWSPDSRMLASVCSTYVIRLWDVISDECHTIQGQISALDCIAWSPDGDLLATGSTSDSKVQIWNSQTRELHLTLELTKTLIISIAWLTTEVLVITSDAIYSYDPKTGNVHSIPADFSGYNNLVSRKDGKLIAACSGDAIGIWDISTGHKIGSIEGHTGEVTALSFSWDGSLLASIALDNTARVWSCNGWEQVALVKSGQHYHYTTQGVAFCPKGSMLATLDEKGTVIKCWNIDFTARYDALNTKSVHYVTAKIALVGDSGVGKTGLGWRLAHDEFREHSSTHGQQFWVLDKLCSTRADETECEAILWDFAGQPDYRLIHSLFLDDVDLALILFDPTNQQDPLKGVEYWIKGLSNRKTRPCRMILVGARLDRGAEAFTQEEIAKLCLQFGVTGGYIPTSALTSEGLTELVECMKSQVRWDEMTAAITSSTFKLIKEYILNLKENLQEERIIVSRPELGQQLELAHGGLKFSDDELRTAARQLAVHGYVTILTTSSGEEMVLLVPELLINLTSSFLLEARRNIKGLGALDEEFVLSGNYPFPELANLTEQEKGTLLDAATTLFIARNICFRETLGAQTLLIFPSLINQKRPKMETLETIEDTAYIVSGSVENIFAALVVLLGYTNTFVRTNQWQNQTEYEMDPGEICGFNLIHEREGEIELVLYYGMKVQLETRKLFQSLFEKFLVGRNASVTKLLPIICGECEYRQERTAVIKRIKADKNFIHCEECGEKISLTQEGREASLSSRLLSKVDLEQELTNLRTMFEASIVTVKGFLRSYGNLNNVEPKCFISYARGNTRQERWIIMLAEDLQNAGINVLFDQWQNSAPGSSISRFISKIESCDFVITVGTPLYREKYVNDSSERGSIVAAEMDLINLRLMNREEDKRTVLPILLEGKDMTAFPPLLRGRVYRDFRTPRAYFANLMDYILTIYRIPMEHRAFRDIRLELRAGLKSNEYEDLTIRTFGIDQSNWR